MSCWPSIGWMSRLMGRSVWLDASANLMSCWIGRCFRTPSSRATSLPCRRRAPIRFRCLPGINGLRRPPVLFVKDGVVHEVVRRETIEDVFAGEARLDAASTWTYNPGRSNHDHEPR